MTEFSFRAFVVLAAVLFAAGAVGIIVAALGPTVGLGEGPNFALYSAIGLSRRDAFQWGIALLMIGIGGGAFAMTRGRPERVRALAAPIAAIWDRHWDRFAPIIRRLDALWLGVNKDWVVAGALVPFALYIGAFWIVAFPDAPWIAPDSQGYLAFFPQRTILYPVLLRLVAAVSDNPNAIVLIQLSVGLAGTIFFAEAAQRLFRNVLATLPTGVFLLFNWPNLEHAFFLLTDYLFYGALCWHFGAVLLAVKSCTPARLVLVAVTASLAMAVRPAGVFLFGTIPFFLLFRPRAWRPIVGYLVLPLAVLTFVQMAAHKAVFGYFGLSNNGGYATLSNTALLLRSDTPFLHPELAQRIYTIARPYREKLDAIPDLDGRVVYNMNSSNYIISDAARAVNEYGKETNSIWLADETAKNRLVAWLNDLSPLNRSYARLGIGNAPHWRWLNVTSEKLAIAAHRHNVSGAVVMTWEKLFFGWRWVLANFSFDAGFIPPHRVMKPDAPRIGFDGPPPERAATAAWAAMGGGFNWVAKWLDRLDWILPARYVVLIAGLASLVFFATQVARPGGASAEIAAFAYLAGSVFVFHVLVNLGSIPIPRLLTPVAAAPMLLYFSPLIPACRRLCTRRAGGWSAGDPGVRKG